MPPSLAKWGVSGGCQSCVTTTTAPAARAAATSALIGADDGLATGHVEAAGGVGEVVLHVDDQSAVRSS